MADQIEIKIGEEVTKTGNTITDLGGYISKVVSMALTVAAVATLVYLVWGGISYIIAGGDKGKIEDAKNRITGAIIGLVITAVAWALFLILDGFFGLGLAGGGGAINGGGGNGGGNSGGISYICVETQRCLKEYCTNPDYVTKTKTGMCPTGYIGCACVNKANPLAK